MRKNLFILAIFFTALCFTTVWADVKESTLEKRLSRTSQSFLNVNASNAGPIPSNLLSNAQGILVFRQYGGGLGLGGKGGFGIVMARQGNGRWGPPAFMKSVDGSVGFQIGGQRVEMVILFMNKESMESFREGRFRIGAAAGATAGPAGANVEGKIGAPVLVYADNTGLYIGAAIEGGVLIPDNEANEAFYHVAGITVPDIIFKGGMVFPSEAEGFRSTLEKHEGKYRNSSVRPAQPRY